MHRLPIISVATTAVLLSVATPAASNPSDIAIGVAATEQVWSASDPEAAFAALTTEQQTQFAAQLETAEYEDDAMTIIELDDNPDAPDVDPDAEPVDPSTMAKYTGPVTNIPGCYSGQPSRTAKSSGGAKLFKYWYTFKWCYSRSRITKATVGQWGGTAIAANWKYAGHVGHARAAQHDWAVGWTQSKFTYSLGPIHRESQPCLRARANRTTKAPRIDAVCSTG